MKDLSLSEVMKLPIEDRLEIIHAIWSSIDATQLPPTDDEIAEVSAAADDYERHPEDVVSWEEVEARLRSDDAETDRPPIR